MSQTPSNPEDSNVEPSCPCHFWRGAIARATPSDHDGRPNGNGSDARTSSNSDAATNKQTKLILDLGRARKMSMSVIERFCQEAVGVTDVYGLTKKQASAVIDRLKQNESAAARR